MISIFMISDTLIYFYSNQLMKCLGLFIFISMSLQQQCNKYIDSMFHIGPTCKNTITAISISGNAKKSIPILTSKNDYFIFSVLDLDFFKHVRDSQKAISR